jgi:hypothetical protein
MKISKFTHAIIELERKIANNQIWIKYDMLEITDEQNRVRRKELRKRNRDFKEAIAILKKEDTK